MAKIVLGYKGSSTSGNRGHAGRLGRVGGSMPRNYGTASAVYASNANVQNLAAAAGVDPTMLNKDGLQAIIDFGNGSITGAQLTAALSNPANIKPSAVGRTPAPAPTPAAPVTPPAPTPAAAPATPPIPAPTTQTTQAAQDMLAILQNPNDPRGAVHSAWANNVDWQTLTPGQIHMLNLYSQGKIRGATLQAGMAQYSASAAAAKPAASVPPPPPPPPAPPKDPRFYQGDVTGKSADEIFNGSSKEVQDLALKTGIIATDQATLDYIKANTGKFERPETYPQVFETWLGSQPQDLQAKQSDFLTKTDPNWKANLQATGISNPSYINKYDNPAQRVGEASSMHAAYMSQAEISVVAKAAAIHKDGMAAYEADYNRNGWRSGTCNAAYHDTVSKGWNSLSNNEQAVLMGLDKKIAAANWVNGSVKSTLPKSTHYVTDPRWRDMTIDKVPVHFDGTASAAKAMGYKYRQELIGKKGADIQPGYKPGETLALSSLSAARDKQVRDQFDTSWDRVNHTFSGTIVGAFNIHPQKTVIDKYSALAKSQDNEKEDLYHGTHYQAARPISATGFIVPKTAKAGRAMGDGVYLADKSSKSSQYIYSSGTGGWGTGRNGVLLLNKAAMGAVVPLKDYQNGGWVGRTSGSGNRYSYYSSNTQNYDTVFGSQRDWRNNEWAVENPAAVLPTVWIDIATK